MQNTSELVNLAEKYALQNAIKFGGKANANAVISKILGEHPEWKGNIKYIAKEVSAVIKEISTLSVEKMTERLQEISPELLEKKEHEKKDIFDFLGIKENEKITTAFPPGPEKYPHIGHAKAAILNYLLAKKYNGRFILRYEDTNPNLVKAIFYDVIADNLSWLGVKWDEVMYASDHMQLFYDLAEKAIKDGNAYMCFCEEEKIRKSRAEGVACECRSQSVDENLKFWREFNQYEAGKAVLRLKIDLNNKNTTMRDPTIFRIIDEPHARHGRKYRVWPTYDWQNAIMDGNFGITHRLRSKEFEMRNELQRHIQRILGLRETKIYEFARFELKGVDTSGRVIREKIQKGEYIGWDDPRLATIEALRRRGFTPEAIRDFVVSTGMTKHESELTWNDLVIHNRRVLDSRATRHSCIIDKVLINIEGAPELDVELHLNPKDKKGGRKFHTTSRFYVSKNDLDMVKEGELVRLMDCLNFIRKNNKFVFDSLEYNKFKSRGEMIINWLPAEGNVDVEILMDDARIVKGIAESHITNLKIGDIIQFERFGFCRLDDINENIYKFWFTHK